MNPFTVLFHHLLFLVLLAIDLSDRDPSHVTPSGSQREIELHTLSPARASF